MKSFLSSFTIIGQCFLVDPPTADPPIADPPTADPTDDVLPVADPFTTDVPTSAASFTEPLTTACDPQPSSARAREKSNCFRSDRETYHMIREWFKSDESLIDDCNKTGMGRTTFYQKRYFVVMMETDEAAFTSLAQEEKRIKHLNKLCKEKLENSPYKRVHKSLKMEGKLLP